MENNVPDKNTAEIINANTTIFLVLTTLYIFSRSYTSSTATLGFLKGRFNSFCGMLLKVAIVAALIYNLTFNFLSTQFDINKIELEIKERLNHTHIIDFKNYSLDLVTLMIYSLKISQFLFASCIFLGISLLVPDSSDLADTHASDSSLIAYNSSISSFCKLWAIFRVPIVFYSGYLNPYLNERLTLFFILIFSNVELTFAALFLLIIKSKNSAASFKSQTDVGLFALTVMSYGIIRYGINLMDLPFQLSRMNLNIITSVQSALMISIYLFLTEIIFPKAIAKVQETSIPPESRHLTKFTNDVQLMDSLVVFEDLKK